MGTNEYIALLITTFCTSYCVGACTIIGDTKQKRMAVIAAISWITLKLIQIL